MQKTAAANRELWSRVRQPKTSAIPAAEVLMKIQEILLKTRLEVNCEAVNCVYNEGHRCAAEHIGIGGGKANSASQTECTSFKAR